MLTGQIQYHDGRKTVVLCLTQFISKGDDLNEQHRNESGTIDEERCRI